MRYRFLLILSTIFLILSTSKAQQQNYNITKSSFSTDRYDEFAPTWYKNGIVFCTNRSSGVTGYSTPDSKGFYKMYKADTSINGKWNSPRPLSKELKTKLNDGPATFSKGRDTIFYSSNLNSSDGYKDISEVRNKLGIYSAVRFKKKWINITPFEYNNKWHNLGFNITTPCLSPDSKKLYFASDKPGGYGGADIYYSEWNNGVWSEPINLGPIINTTGNEAYPYINSFGELIFSSDGHPGYGGKDIFLAMYNDSEWLKPIRFEAPINSEYDDFGMITDSSMMEGLFSSNRNGSLDIFHFRSIIPEILYAELQKENNYCYFYRDTISMYIDTNLMEYQWYVGDQKVSAGDEFLHCFGGPGQYIIRLDIQDRATKKKVMTKREILVNLADIKQPYIAAPDTVINGDSVYFSAEMSNLPGFKILNFNWDFGDGNRSIGKEAYHIYKTAGTFIVKLGLIVRSDESGEVTRKGISKIIVSLEDGLDLIKSDHVGRHSITMYNILESSDVSNLKVLYDTEQEFDIGGVYGVEIISSVLKMEMNDPFFKRVPGNYTVLEVFNQVDSTFSYLVNPQNHFMNAYIYYHDMTSRGYDKSVIKVKSPEDPIAKEFYEIIRTTGTSYDIFFDRNDKLTATAYLFLDRLIRFMKSHPTVKIQVSVHSDLPSNSSTYSASSIQNARLLANYVISRGISSTRISAVGNENLRTVTPNLDEASRKLSRRVEFQIREL